MAFVNVARIAQVLNLDPRRVQQLVKEGMPRHTRGRYEALKCMAWYIRFLQKVIEKKAIPMDEGEYASERQERVRKMRFDADLKEIELARERSQLVAIADVEKEITNLALTVKARIMAVAPRLAPDLLGEGSRVMAQAKIEKALREALAQLATEADRLENCTEGQVGTLSARGRAAPREWT
ncbi:MAG TPA: hypothetical protein VKS20_11015 [Candidatus Acidoferrales bacterium]|nr:hypothetical protein [Candidatus Acidoferrales bacterium]